MAYYSLHSSTSTFHFEHAGFASEVGTKYVVADTLHAVSEGENAEEETTFVRRQVRKHVDRQVVDTIPPDPKQIKPLPPNMPLQMKPQMLDENYWEQGLIHIEKGPFAQKLDSITRITDSTFVSVPPTGIAGDPVPYQFRTDSIVTIILMVSFFLVVWVTSLSRHYLHEQVKDFFHYRQRENLFSERTQTEMRGQVFLIFQTCFLLAILFFDYTQEFQTEVFNQLSPYKILGVSMGICCLYFTLKIGVYAFVNNIFFERKKKEQWTEAYLLCVLGTGLALLPLTLLVVYFDFSFTNTAICFACIIIVDKILLFYKCSRIFFNYTFGIVHLFLYFCTLEIVPIFILFRALIYANNFLLIINQ